MHKFLNLPIISFCCVAAAAPAFAEPWTLRFGGASVGAARTEVDWTDKSGTYFTFSPNTKYSVDVDGATIGIHGGQWFERQNQVVLGWEASYNWFDHDTKEKSRYYPTLDTWETTFNRSFSVVGRVGRASGKWLPYVEAGISVADISFEVIDNTCGTPCRIKDGGWHPGYVLGFGVDYRASEDILVGVNYRYADYQEKTYESPDNSFLEEKFSLGAKSQIISLRVSYLF